MTPWNHHTALTDRAEQMHVEWRNLWLHTARAAAEDLVNGRVGPVEAQRRIERLAEVYRRIMSRTTPGETGPWARVTRSPWMAFRCRAVSPDTNPSSRHGA